MQIKLEEPSVFLSKPQANSSMQIENASTNRGIGHYLFQTSQNALGNSQTLNLGQAQQLLQYQSPTMGSMQLRNTPMTMLNQPSQLRELASTATPYFQQRMAHSLTSIPESYGRSSSLQNFPLKYEDPFAADLGTSGMVRGQILSRNMLSSPLPTSMPQIGLGFQSTTGPIFQSGPLNLNAASNCTSDQLRSLFQPTSNLQTVPNIQINTLPFHQTVSQSDYRPGVGILNKNLQDELRYKQLLMPQHSHTDNLLESSLQNRLGLGSFEGLELNKFNSTPLIGSTNSLDEEIYAVSTKPTLKTFTGMQSRNLNNPLESLSLCQSEFYGGIRGETKWRTDDSLDSFSSKILSAPDITSYGPLFGGARGTLSGSKAVSGFDRICEGEELSYRDFSRSLPVTYEKETRAQKVQRYRLKRLKWKDTHTVVRNYSGRSAAANSKPRIKGRFVKSGEYEKYKAQVIVKEEMTPSIDKDCESHKTTGEMKIEEEF